MGILAAVLPTILEYTIKPITRHVSYPFNWKSNVGDLEEKVQALKDAKERLEYEVETERRNGKEIDSDVVEWLKKVDEFLVKESAELVQANEQANTKCFFGFCPNLKKRDHVSRKAEKQAADVAKLCQRRDEFSTITHVAPLQGMEALSAPLQGIEALSSPLQGMEALSAPLQGIEALSAPLQGIEALSAGDYVVFESRVSVFEKVKNALTAVDVFRVGLYGLGGMGKTTLAKEVARQAKEEKLFDEVVFVSVTKDVNVKNIQGKIADQLGLQFEGESVEERASRLYERLKLQNMLLVILDDLWEELDLEAVGILSKNQPSGCKMLLTSRDREVLSYWMDCENNFEVGALSENEAWDHITKMVGNNFENDDRQATAVEVAKACGGFPNAIVRTAMTLKNNNSLDELKETLKKLQEPDSMIYSTIKSSYHNLETKELKSIFLLCSQMGYNTTTRDLLKYGIGLGLFENDFTLEYPQFTMLLLVNRLKAMCLLIEGSKTEEIVMYDVVRKTGRMIASSNGVLIADDESMTKVLVNKDKLKGQEEIWVHGYVDELPQEMQCPELLLFHVNGTGVLLQIQDNLFEGLNKLKVLSLSRLSIPSLPSSLGLLKNLKTLCFHGLFELGDVSIVGELKKLEVLSFANSRIMKLSEEIGQLTRLKLLDLSNCFKLEVVAPKVLSRLSQLEELYMCNSFTNWDIEGQRAASFIELVELASLTTLEIDIQDVKLVSLEKIHQCKDTMQSFWSTLRIIRVADCERMKHLFSFLVAQGFSQLQEICVDDCKNIEEIISEEGESTNIIELSELERLTLQGLPKLNSFCCNISEENTKMPISLFNDKVLLPNLLELKIEGMQNCEKIWHRQLETDSFYELRKLRIGACKRVVSIFPSSLLKRFVKLEELNIYGCESLEEIFEVEGSNANGVAEEMSFQLRDLTLQKLPKLRRIWSSDPQIHVTFPNLRSVEIRECQVLENVFPRSLAETLKKLENLQVWECGSAEIIAKTEDGETTDIVWPSLKELSVPCPELLSIKVNSSNLENLSLVGRDEKVTHLLQLAVFPKIKDLKLEDFDDVHDGIPLGFLQKFPKLERLDVADSGFEELFYCDGVSAENMMLPQIKQLEVDGLNNIRHLWEQKNGIHVFTPLLNLETLQLSDCHSLVNVIPSPASFQNLTSLSLQGCHGLSNVFTMGTAKSLLKLKELEVTSCEKVTEIIANNLGDQIENEEVIFTNLQSCKLDRLPCLTCFSSINHSLSFPSLTELIVIRCPKMRVFSPGPLTTPNLEKVYSGDAFFSRIFYRFFGTSFWEGNLNRTIEKLYIDMVRLEEMSELKLSEFPALKEIWHFALPVVYFRNLERLVVDDSSFRKLETLVVDDCSFFPCAVRCTLLPCLGKLTKLEVKNCDSLETVFDLESPDGVPAGRLLPQLPEFLLEKLQFVTDGVPAGRLLPQLTDLLLCDLPKLRFVCSGYHPRILEFRSLTSLMIHSCNNLRHVFTTSMALSLVQLRKMDIRNCIKVKEIVFEGVEEVAAHDKKEIFPELTDIILQSLPKLTHINSGKCILNLGSLKWISIENCPNMRPFVSSQLRGQVAKTVHPGKEPRVGMVQQSRDIQTSSSVPHNKVAFSCLEKLRLDWNDEIKQGGCVVPKFSNTLKSLELVNFPNKHIASFLQRFPNLPELVLTDVLFKEIAHDEIIEEDGHAQLLENLRTLKLSKLSKLMLMTTKESLLCSVFQRLETLQVSECNIEKVLIPSWASFQNLTILEVSKCNHLLHLLTFTAAKSLTKLTRLSVTECSMIKQIVTNEGKGTEHKVKFDKLKSLEFRCLPNLIGFSLWTCNLEFPSLEEVLVKECSKMEIFSRGDITAPDLKAVLLTEAKDKNILEGGLNATIKRLFEQKEPASLTQSNSKPSGSDQVLQLDGRDGITQNQNVFPIIKALTLNRFVDDEWDGIPLGFLQRLEKLEKLKVSDSSFEELFSRDGVAAENVKLPRLKHLEVSCLHNMRHLWRLKNDGLMSPLLHDLETLHLSSCHSLVNVPSSASFENLTCLSLQGCHGLSNVFTVTTAESLSQLIQLNVSHSKMVTEIMGKEEDEKEDEEVTFMNLKSCVLHNLPSLTSFCSSNYSLSFPLLTELVVASCPRMRDFSTGPLSTPKLQQLSLYNSKRSCKDDLNTTIQQLYTEMVGFEGIYVLKHSEFPELKDKWHDPQLKVKHFSWLRELVVDGCSSFASAVPCTLLPCLGNLRELDVRKCNSLEAVFDLESLNADAVPLRGLLPLLGELCLSDLPNLRYVCSKNPKRNLELVRLERLRIHNCNNLTHIFTTSMALHLVNLQKIEIGNCDKLIEIVTEEGEEEAEIHHGTMFPELTDIILQSLPKLMNINSGKAIFNLGSLKEISIKKCPSMKLFISSLLKGQVPNIQMSSMVSNEKGTLLSLEILRLEWNYIVQTFKHSSRVTNEVFSKLKVLELIKLPNHLLSYFLHRFPNLQSLVITDAVCREIVSHEEIIQEDLRDTLLQNLRELKLSNLPQLEHLTREESWLCSGFHRLETLQVLECSIREILVPSSVSFQNLTILKVSKCDSLFHLITPTVARSLVQLKSMSITECSKIEQIVRKEEKQEKDTIAFSNLESLELLCLPNLIGFSSWNCEFGLPSLEVVVVRECSKMKTFSWGIIKAPKLKKVWLREAKDKRCWDWEHDLNTTIHKLFQDISPEGGSTTDDTTKSQMVANYQTQRATTSTSVAKASNSEPGGDKISDLYENLHVFEKLVSLRDLFLEIGSTINIGLKGGAVKGSTDQHSHSISNSQQDTSTTSHISLIPIDARPGIASEEVKMDLQNQAVAPLADESSQKHEHINHAEAAEKVKNDSSDVSMGRTPEED